MPTDQSENSPKPKVAVAQSCVSFAKTMVNLGLLCIWVLDGLKYASSHEWAKHEGSVVTIGEALFQDHLGEVVFVELPEDGHSVSQRGSFGAVEGVKVTRDVNSPISGKVVEVNSKLTESPGLFAFTAANLQILKQKPHFEEFMPHRKVMKCHQLNPSLLHWRQSLSLLQEADNKTLDRLTKSKEAALLGAERNDQIAWAKASLVDDLQWNYYLAPDVHASV
ncbi:hypothetical protein DVH24_016455 [Malus domestica]|uniref:Lipoyl-binding domain-containing protein n=1 Tax=Malus domestica TaxID=3750 RepID=A0A498HXK9_MALDO|nr:hypothetical protein DVH24_016455 [Malus domestica]